VLSHILSWVPCTILNSELGYHVLSQIPNWGIVYYPGAYTSIFWAKIQDRCPGFGPLIVASWQFLTADPNLGFNLPAFQNLGYHLAQSHNYIIIPEAHYTTF